VVRQERMDKEVQEVQEVEEGRVILGLQPLPRAILIQMATLRQEILLSGTRILEDQMVLMGRTVIVELPTCTEAKMERMAPLSSL